MLLEQFINGLDPLEILRFDELLERLTPDLLRDAAVKYFDPSRMVQGVLLPETDIPSTADGPPPVS